MLAALFTDAQPSIHYQSIATGFNEPVALKNAGDDRLFIVERAGLIKILKNNVVLPSPFLDIRDQTSTEGDRGLLSIAFHPDYKTNGYFFVYYTQKMSRLRSSGAVTIARYKVSAIDSNVADPNSSVILLRVLKPLSQAGVTFADHNGGDLHFGRDGYLYFGIGDGGKESGISAAGDPYNNSQNDTSALGKFIRLNVNSTAGIIDTAVLAKGLRNPWRWSFDRENGDLWIGDVGHYKWEEVDYVKNETTNPSGIQLKKGLNFGWRCYEADEPYDASNCPPANFFDFPVFKYVNQRSTGGAPASITGGYVYRGATYPGLYGYYICSDLYSGAVTFIKPNGTGGWTSYSQTGLDSSIVSYGEDKEGELYAVSIGSGKLFKVIYTGTIVALPEVEALVTGGSLLYPNPAHNRLTILSNEPLYKASVTITNAVGTIVLNDKLYRTASRSIELNVATLTTGLYYLSLKTAKGIQTLKFIKE